MKGRLLQVPASQQSQYAYYSPDDSNYYRPQHYEQSLSESDKIKSLIQHSHGKPVFAIDWDSDSIESDSSEQPPKLSESGATGEQQTPTKFNNGNAMVFLQQRRNGFIDSYIYTEE